jgi:hypothetical protein
MYCIAIFLTALKARAMRQQIKLYKLSFAYCIFFMTALFIFMLLNE